MGVVVVVVVVVVVQVSLDYIHVQATFMLFDKRKLRLSSTHSSNNDHRVVTSEGRSY